VCNTSCLIVLEAIGRLDLLQQVYQQLVIPPAVGRRRKPITSSEATSRGGNVCVKLIVSPEEAAAHLHDIEHSICQRSIRLGRWQVDEMTLEVRPQSVFWLYCWAKTGMGSDRAAEEAQRAFDAVLDIWFNDLDAVVDHDRARGLRYYLNKDVPEVELRELLEQLPKKERVDAAPVLPPPPPPPSVFERIKAARAKSGQAAEKPKTDL